MNNLETTVELNGVLQKNIEWQKANNDTLKHIIRKREEQLYQCNNDLLKSKSEVTKWQTISAILSVISAILLLTN
jgi:hypothetical protein